MSEKHIIETLGSVSKVENIRALEHHIITNTFVVETLEPFPGYHGVNFLTDDIVKKSVFFVIKQRISAEILCRAVAKMRKYLPFPFDAAIAELTIFNQMYHAIRIKRFVSMENIDNLHHAFRDEGFEFVKRRKIGTTKGIIRIKKYMLLEDAGDGLYFDSIDTNIAYFALPAWLNWKMFEEITLQLKHNLPESDFDLALGVIFRRTGLVDVVRVFADKPDVELLKTLKTKYEEAIRRIL